MRKNGGIDIPAEKSLPLPARAGYSPPQAKNFQKRLCGRAAGVRRKRTTGDETR
jgi:hypothetical protein